ncbi:regulator of hemoglobinization and erythroid cell expansion protein [Neopelma chrysocephalum]|uniref:regulator of hemoglobinization and erythroid cell expansion protein n=1 Tax=Neopelma chrysocephalum TaxID=114329 RepID=UPI000FCD16FC|nr:regulator of hemoglobinization and erythroid cell expansion protein [Neopelma chrysocephalum]
MSTSETPHQENDLLWIFVIISAVTLLLYALLLLSLYFMLSRKIAQHSHGMQGSSSPVAQPTPDPTPSAGGAKAQQPAPAYAGSSDTSSDTSSDSSDSPSCPQGQGSGGNINYTSLVFPGKGRGAESAKDYENMKTGTDYVNVDPKKKKAHLWPCSSPVASKPVEYTEVKL